MSLMTDELQDVMVIHHTFPPPKKKERKKKKKKKKHGSLGWIIIFEKNGRLWIVFTKLV